MDGRRREPEREVLPEKVSERLLRRASELDVANRSGAEVAKLRAAAVEAGISQAAFDAALAELREEQNVAVAAPAPRRTRRSPAWAIVVGTIAILLAGVITMRTMVPPPPTIGEQRFALQCLSPDQAMMLVRPLLVQGGGTVQSSPSSVPGTITVRASPQQMERVRSTLARQDGAGSAACAPPRR